MQSRFILLLIKKKFSWETKESIYIMNMSLACSLSTDHKGLSSLAKIVIGLLPSQKR